MVYYYSMPDKVIGYILLISGILIILLAGFSVYQAFTGNTKPFNLFNFSNIPLTTTQTVETSDEGAKVSQNVNIPADILNDPINLIAHIFLMGFVATVGFRIASLGTMMARPIVVKLKSEKPM